MSRNFVSIGWLRVPALVGLLLAFGCGRSLTSSTLPASAPPDDLQLDSDATTLDAIAGSTADGNFTFPLELGNWWEYRRRVDFESTAPFGTTYGFETTFDTEIFCLEPYGGATYSVGRINHHGVRDPYQSYIYYRQDAAGLYELDGTGAPSCKDESTESAARPGPTLESVLNAKLATMPAESRAGARREFERQLEVLREVSRTIGVSGSTPVPNGSPSVELTRLSYPLFRGKTWVLRDSPRFVATAMLPQRLLTRAGPVDAWRIRIDSDLFGPKDRVFTWYGPVGYIGLRARLQGYASPLSARIFEGLALRTIMREDLLGYDFSRRPR